MANECCISVSKSAAQDQEFKGKVPFQDINIDFKSEINKKSYDENKIARIWKYKSISISSDLEDGIPKRLPKTKAYAQAFLPMLTVTGLGAIINGDFSTDPSRTRIATDEHTKKIMTDVIELISELLYQQSIEQLSPEDSQLLEIIIPYHKADILDISPSIIASSIKNAAKDAGIDYSSFLIKLSWMTIDDYKNYCLLNSRKAVLYEQLSNQDYYGFF